MKTVLFLISFTLLFASCEEKKKPVIVKEEVKIQLPVEDTTFPGFMGLKWYSNFDEGLKYFRENKTDLRVISTIHKYDHYQNIELKGKFSGFKTDNVSMDYENGKLALVTVDLGIHLKDEIDIIQKNISEKYKQKAVFIDQGYNWTFETENKNDTTKDACLMLFEDPNDMHTLLAYFSAKHSYYSTLRENKVKKMQEEKVKKNKQEW